MPFFDPSKPADNSLISSSELRDQLNGLQENIQQLYNDSGGNCLGVNYLNLTVSNPPTQAEMQSLANKVDEILTFLRRE